MIVKIKKLSKDAVVPKKAHATDAGFDLVAVSKEYDDDNNVVYGTGLAFEIPDGHVGLLFPRSSNAKKDLVLSNCVGVIDSGYRGEVTLKFKRLVRTGPAGAWTGKNRYDIGDRIGPLIIMPIPDIEFVEAGELSDSERGTGGYGSSGK
jgi:dUTP pyrophosphatase